MKDKCGFTLIEMLIVVVIIGILTAIVLPKMTNGSRMARENACKENISNINRVFELIVYDENIPVGDLDGFFPIVQGAASAFPGNWGASNISPAIMQKYFPDGGVACPMGTDVNTRTYVILNGRVEINNAASNHAH